MESEEEQAMDMDNQWIGSSDPSSMFACLEAAQVESVVMTVPVVCHSQTAADRLNRATLTPLNSLTHLAPRGPWAYVLERK